MSEWGRVAEDGTVYVKTEDGERAVGSWHAGAPEEGLAHFVRRYEQMATEVQLLEQRLRAGVGDPRQVATSAARLKAQVPAAAAVGDLASLERRVDALVEKTAEAAEAAKAVKAEERVKIAEVKSALAEEAEKLSGSSDWKGAGERLRTLGDDWKKAGQLDKKADDELWQRVAAARKRFTERRTTHFAALEQQREVSKQRKEELVKQAQQLSASVSDKTDFRATADRYKQLMQDWKTAGRAPREVEDSLWQQFKAAQDVFFGFRNQQFAEQDEEFKGNQTLKEEILAEAEALDPAQGLDKAKARLRQLQERWEAVGKVPRDAMRSLEDRMGAVEEKIRDAGAVPARPIESSFTVKLRERIAELEQKLARAQAAGRPTADLEQQLATQREWLVSSGASAGAAPSAGQGGARKPKTTGGWVRSDA
jgi:hypothetical protein